QAEDGIRDRNVTGVQTCALPICFYCFYCLVIVYDEFHLPRLYPLCPPSFLELRLFPSTDFTTTDGPNLVGPLTPIPLYIIIPAHLYLFLLMSLYYFTIK